MARSTSSALSNLAKLADERRALDARERATRAEAAVEIGTALLDAGAERIELKLLERAVRRMVELGGAEALKRLDAKAV